MSIFYLLLPTMVLLIGMYLLLYQYSLRRLLGLENSKLIIMLAVTYFILSFLGFFIILNTSGLIPILWMIFIVAFTLFVIWLLRNIYRHNNPK